MHRRTMIAGAGATIIAGAGAGVPATASRAGESLRLPAALPEGTRRIATLVDLADKQQMVRLSDRPPNYATPVEVFANPVTPNDRFFIRYHLAGLPSVADMDNWSLTIGGDGLTRPMQLKLDDLRHLPMQEVLAVCQCAGNRRGLSIPHVPGVQWPDGGMGCAVWRGPALRDVLKTADVKAEAIEVWLGGADKPPLDATPAFRKSIPIEKALDGGTILAISMNGAPLPLLNGYPARLVVPGWAGTYWLKHLTNIEVSRQPLANFWMKSAYRLPAGMFPVDHPFKSQATETTVPITELVVNSLIADPIDGDERGRSGFGVRGVAWDRGNGIGRVEVSLDGGGTWQDAVLDPPLGLYAYRRFSVQTGAIGAGQYSILSRATSQTGERQASALKANPGGYHNNVPLPITVAVQ
jgi:DMSO/TMAO reductase YedYZ molybdopterin-dependent catalytic subunit